MIILGKTALDRIQRAEHGIQLGGLVKEIVCACLDEFGAVLRIGIVGQDDYNRRVRALFKVAEDIHSTAFIQTNIQQHDIGPQAVNLLQGLLRSGRKADDLSIFVVGHEGHEAFTHID
jgi:hypothetical protein